MVQDSINNPKQSILLDLSLFIIDLLDTNKIQKNATSNDHILEVPSALVQMLRDSRVGSPTLFLFIYSLLIKTINKYKLQQINDSRIAKLATSPDYVIRGEAWRTTQNLFNQFSSLIDIAPKTDLPYTPNPPAEINNGNSNFPIRRYDFIGPFSNEDQLRLQAIYTRELNLPTHPLYDQYFSQIYHAQSIGITDVSTPRRRTVSLDEETFNIVSKWKGHEPLYDKKDADIIKTSRDFLRWFTLTYIKDEWKSLVFDATLELCVAAVLNGSISGFGVSLVTLIGGTIIIEVAKASPEVVPPELKPIIIIIVMVIMFVCLIILVRPVWFLIKPKLTPTITPLPTSTLNSALQNPLPTFTLVPSTVFIQPTQILITPTIISIHQTQNISSPNYCMYVIQSGDTLQSVAAWFLLTEDNIKSSDDLVRQNIFGLHQLVKVNAPCCTHIGINNGFSYSVQLKDNVFRLATNFTTSVTNIMLANNLGDSRYIQAGQMLCIPNQ